MNDNEFADLLWGAQAIADFIGKNYRQTVYLGLLSSRLMVMSGKSFSVR
jgi:hypothetical protein